MDFAFGLWQTGIYVYKKVEKCFIPLGGQGT